MRTFKKTSLSLALGVAIGAGGFQLLSSTQNPARADDTRQKRMDDNTWTTGDRARDALDHLKKAEVHMNKIADSENSKVAKDAAKLCVDARAKVDEFITELDKREKKKDH